jgi:hypothetical protein
MKVELKYSEIETPAITGSEIYERVLNERGKFI